MGIHHAEILNVDFPSRISSLDAFIHCKHCTTPSCDLQADPQQSITEGNVASISVSKIETLHCGIAPHSDYNLTNVVYKL